MNKSKNVMSLWPLTIAVAIILCSTCVVNATIDYNPPSWIGEPGTTYQLWAFGDDTNPSGPDDYTNTNGVASLQVVGAPPQAYWKDEDLGHYGVWRFEDEMIINIPNFPDPNPYKEVWLQMTFNADGATPEASAPDVFLTPTGGTGNWMTLIDIVPDDDNYWNATFQGFMYPNPRGETISIRPRNCSIYIDDIVIDTICVPEPMTLSLLSIGGLALLRKRKHR